LYEVVKELGCDRSRCRSGWFKGFHPPRHECLHLLVEGFGDSQVQLALSFDDSSRNMNEAMPEGFGELWFSWIVEKRQKSKEVMCDQAEQCVGVIGFMFTAGEMPEVKGNFLIALSARNDR
jgi:hypothetical protein